MLIIALKEELPRNLLPEFKIEYCGLREINATYKALEIISKYEPKLRINFGTSGSLRRIFLGFTKCLSFSERHGC